MKLFTGLQSYLPGREISETNIKVVLMATVFVELCGCRWSQLRGSEAVGVQLREGEGLGQGGGSEDREGDGLARIFGDRSTALIGLDGKGGIKDES